MRRGLGRYGGDSWAYVEEVQLVRRAADAGGEEEEVTLQPCYWEGGPAPGPLVFNSNCVEDAIKTLDSSICMYRNSKGESKRLYIVVVREAIQRGET